MNINTKNNSCLIFTTDVLQNQEKEEFIVEFFPYSSSLDGQDNPVMITKTFDELISFFEQLE